MEFFPTSKILVSFGIFNITWYALFVVGAACLCYEVCARNLVKLGYKKEMAEDLFFGMLPWAFIGARLWFVVFELPQFLADPITIFYVWEGGLGIYGGIFAGIAYGLYFARKHKISFLRWGDEIVPNLLLAQSIGRWGNFVNQEAYGRVVSESYYKFFPTFIKEQMYIQNAFREPTFLYESVANIIGWVIITFLYKKTKNRNRGDLICAYFAWYGVSRFFIEGLRTDSLYIFNTIRVSQLTSIVLIIIAFYGIIVGFKKFIKKKPVVLFDLDGTLIDSDALIFDSFKHVFNTFEPQLEVTEEMLLSFLGPSLEESFKKYSSKDINMLITEYRQHNNAVHEELLKPIPSVVEALKDLKDNGYKIGVVTTKYSETAYLGMRICGIEEYVDVVVGGDEVDKQKPNPQGVFLACDKLLESHDYIVYVGDSPADIQVAHNALALSIGVKWTAKGSAILEVEEPAYMIDSLLEVRKLIEEKFI